MANRLTGDRLNSTLELHPARVDPGELARSVMGSAHVITPHHRLILETGSDLPVIDGEPQLLRVVLLNLLSNAIKFSPDDSPVCLRMRRDDDGLCIEVRDDGPGIAAARRERPGPVSGWRWWRTSSSCTAVPSRSEVPKAVAPACVSSCPVGLARVPAASRRAIPAQRAFARRHHCQCPQCAARPTCRPQGRGGPVPGQTGGFQGACRQHRGSDTAQGRRGISREHVFRRVEADQPRLEAGFAHRHRCSTDGSGVSVPASVDRGERAGGRKTRHRRCPVRPAPDQLQRTCRCDGRPFAKESRC